ncbi:uncharacterized protein LOC111882144 [Lactuca sativa]|uniref:uncharacterized protein LOC111882144 n=1 Tax=Lactuca sativa TaxID=4236 RepID=UPI000CD81E08|nr:uncharacterized protein LOC111882144 [Lactuca sativa]
MAIDTKEEVIYEFLEALEVEPKPSEPKPKKSKIKNEEAAEMPDSRRDPISYKPPFPFPSRAHLSLLERKHLEFIRQIKGIPINAPFIDSLAKVPEYAKFLQDLIDTQHELKKNSKVILSEQSSRDVLGEIPKKMGDLGHLTLPCEFGNKLKTYALADSGTSINLIPFSFYQKLNIQKMKGTKM